MKSFAFVAMAGAMQSPSGMAAPHAAHTIFRTSAMVESGAIDKTGVPWFKTWDEDARFILEKEPADRAHELFLLLGKSRDNSRSVEVTFDASAVRLNPATGTLDFPICAVRLEETVFTAARRCGDKAIEARKVSASPLL